MMEYLWNVLEEKGIFAGSKREQERLERGMLLYLKENGISPEEQRPYFAKYLDHRLKQIAVKDLKTYFLEYPTISQVQQIAMEYKCDGTVPHSRAEDLYQLMGRLYEAGLGTTYVPAVEIREILGRNA